MSGHLTYKQRRDMIVTHAWETWTKNGLGLGLGSDAEARREIDKIVQDAVSNTYVDGITDQAWLAAALERLVRR